MLVQIWEVILGKIGEQVTEYAHKTVRSMTDFDSTMETLKKNIELLSATATEVEEQIKNAERSGKKKRKKAVEVWLKDVKAIETEFPEWENELELEGFIGRFVDGGATQLNERVNGLIEQSLHLGELLLDVHETTRVPFLTTGMVGKAFEENLERIWGLLVTDEVLSIGIHGMGGVGKTTLIQHIHNRLLEKKESVFWITVSQVFTIKKLQDEIAHAVHVQFSDKDTEAERAARLCHELSQRKNSILILDDVSESFDMRKVGYPLNSVETSCRLVLTSRSEEVCRQIGCREMIAVETLHRDEAWNLFSERLKTKLTHDVEVIAKRMTKMCGGLPLAIITLARSMRGKTAKYEWEDALEQLKIVMGQEKMEKDVFPVLKYSFDRLSPNHQGQGGQRNGYNSLQRCFLRCSLYPEDYKIRKKDLVKKFISEELMDKRGSRKAYFNQGLSILDKLVNVNLLESTTNINGDDCVKMHDLVRAMALKITEGKTMVIAGDYSLVEIPIGEEWTKDIEKMSLMENGIVEIPPGISPNFPKLSTLLLCGNALKFLPDSFFSQMHGLCILDFSQTNIKKLPNSLSDLESLKALLLERCEELEYVPYLGRLKALRELDLSGTAIKEVPPGIEELVNLKFLSIDARKLGMFPSGLLLRFPNLQYLKFPNHLEAPIEEIEKLKLLEEVWGRVKNMLDFNRFIRSGRNRVHDTSYNILVGSAGCGEFWEGYNKQVKLYKYNLKDGEEKDETMLGHDIQRLTLVNSEGLSNCFLNDFARLINNPISLKILEIKFCGGIEYILNRLQSQLFLTLEEIVLRGLRDFKGIIIHQEEREIGRGGRVVVSSAAPSIQLAVFSSLTRLQIYHCDKMKKLELSVSEFPILEEITVHCCAEIEEIIVVGNDNDDGRGEGEAAHYSKLKLLNLFNLPRLKATMICPSIETICLGKCPRLKKLPLEVVAPPPSLKEIRIFNEEKEWWESLEWEDPTHPLLLQPFLRFFG